MSTPYIAEYRGAPGTTPFMRLQGHIKQHAYKKGRYAGAAPADTARRGKSHFRVELRDYYIAVVFHYTDILIAFDDGRVALNSDGYAASPTTRSALEDALWLAGYKGWVRSDIRNGYLNTVLHIAPAPGAPWRKLGWADTITISPTGEVTGYAPLKAYRADTQARKAWRMHPEVQEFKAVLPILLAGLERQIACYPRVYDMADAVLDRERWADLAQTLSYKAGYDAARAWAYLDHAATEGMRVVVNAD